MGVVNQLYQKFCGCSGRGAVLPRIMQIPKVRRAANRCSTATRTDSAHRHPLKVSVSCGRPCVAAPVHWVRAITCGRSLIEVRTVCCNRLVYINRLWAAHLWYISRIFYRRDLNVVTGETDVPIAPRLFESTLYSLTVAPFPSRNALP